MPDNPDEWFDVVDEQDRVTGRARRGEVHARGLRHRAVHVLVQRPDGALFLQQRSLGKDSSPGLWDSSASGHLDSGEDYDAAAVRELREELGVDVEALERLGHLEAGPPTGMEFVRIYRARHAGPFRLHPEEITTGRWVTAQALRDWLGRAPGDFAPCFHAVWEAVGARFG
jgi:isopentenyldiphosphate isomerase